MLRVVACLSIVFLHSTTNIGRTIDYAGFSDIDVYRVLLNYATPTFIILSEIILANKYPNGVPDNFFKKRIKYILFPFASFALIDALVAAYVNNNYSVLWSDTLNNLSGLYLGYFILIIFQFYILHYIITKFKINVEKMLPISIIIMIVYLYCYHNVEFMYDNRYYLRLPFIAWIGYFTVAYLIGKHYQKIAPFIKKHKWTMLLAVFFTGMLVFERYYAGVGFIDSRRWDLFPFVVMMSLTILAWGQLLPKSKIINTISDYSLGIYLVHWQVMELITPTVNTWFSSVGFQIIVLFTLSVVISMVFIRFVLIIPGGSFIVGKSGKREKKSRVTSKLNCTLKSGQFNKNLGG